MAHDEISDHYSALARAAAAGRVVADCGQDAFERGGFHAAGYDELSVLPEGAVRASLGCGNPVAVAELQRGETVLDLGSGGGFSEWGQVFADEVLATAILDRLLPHCDVISINGPGYRLKNRLRNIDQAAEVA